MRGHGPFVYFTLEVSGDTITKCSPETYGCPSAIRCADWVAKWSVGRAVQSLTVLEPSDLILVLGGLPLGKEHCAELAVQAVRDAIRQWHVGTTQEANSQC